MDEHVEWLMKLDTHYTSRYGLDEGELLGEIYIAAAKAESRHDPNEAPFRAYAAIVVRNHITSFMRPRVSGRKITRALESETQERGYVPSLQDLVDDGLLTQDEVSRYSPVPQEVLVGVPETTDDSMFDLEKEFIRDEYLLGLTEREWLVVVLKYEEDMTTTETAQAMGLSSSFVRRVLKSAKAKVWENISRIRGD